MFIGHFAPAFVAASHPKAPGLGILFVAGQLVDFGFFGLSIVGTEHFRITPGTTAMNPLDLYDMPYTHSLLGTSVWALAFAFIVLLFTKNRIGAVIAGAVVLSHWFLDFLVHAPDLTFAGQPPLIGLGLWNYPLIAIPLELILTFGALAFYIITTQANTPLSRYVTALMIILLAGFQSINWGPPETANLELKIAALISFTVAAIVAWWLGSTRMSKKV